jgi:hypothetical protein
MCGERSSRVLFLVAEINQSVGKKAAKPLPNSFAIFVNSCQ